MGAFDTTGRRVAKRKAIGFFGWSMPQFLGAVPFAGWLDARTVPTPPESELTCDALAEFLDPTRPEQPWMMVSEFQTEPRGDDLERMVEYMMRFRRERHPDSDPRLKYEVGGLMLNLTGPEQRDTLSMPLPGLPEFGTSSRVVRIAVREQDAQVTLQRIASGELDRCVLPWVALMRGSGDSSIIEEWKRVADGETDPRVRLEYAADALVFVELPGVWSQWKQSLEGWNVRTSQQVLEWQKEAEVRTSRKHLLRVLEVLCGSAVPADIASAVQVCADPEQLSRWDEIALRVKSYDEFRSRMN